MPRPRPVAATIAAAVAAVGLTLTGLTSAWADTGITSDVKVTPPTAKLTGAEWRSISLSGDRIIKHATQALTDLTDHKDQAATTNVDQAAKLVQIIDAALPSTKVTTTIADGDLKYTDDDMAKPRFVPLYREFDTVDVMSSVAEQKARAARAAAGGGGTAPEESLAALDYTSVRLDVALARQDLAAAQAALKDNKPAEATTALQDLVGNGVVLQFSQVDEPLVRAMDNFHLAQAELDAGDPAQASVALSGASDALKNYQAMTGEAHSKQIEQLQKEIGQAKADVSHESAESFRPKTEGWWAQCRNWLHL